MIARGILACGLLLTLAGPAAAQLRTLVVPEGAAVVVPPRGGGAIRAPLAQARSLAPAPAPTPPPGAAPAPIGAGPLAAMAAVPLAVAVAVLASNLPGSSTVGSGPARTR